MNLKNLFSRSHWQKKITSTTPTSSNLDHKLVKKMHPHRIPRLQQLKYVGQFLSPFEKRALQVLSTIIFTTVIASSALFLFLNVTTIPKDGGEYSEALIGQPKNINPIFSSINDVDTDLAALIYSGLFRYDGIQNLVGDLAESYTVSTDKKTYDIKLRSGVRWSDGEEFNADDVLYTFETIQNPEVGSPLLATFQDIKVEKINDLALRFRLREPFAPFLNSLTVGILPAHIWSSVTSPAQLKLATINLQPIGTGPWKFEKLVKKDDGSIQTYLLTRNENFYGTKPHLQTLQFSFFDDYETALEKLHSQEVLAVSFLPRESKEKIQSRKLNTFSLHLPQYTALFFNQSKSLLDSSDVRRALALGVNKQAVVEQALQSEGKILDTPILEGQIGYYPDSKKIPFNPNEANTLLDKQSTRIQPEEYFKLRYDSLTKAYKEELKNENFNSNQTSTTPQISTSTLNQAEQDITNAVRKEMSPDQTFYRKDKKNNLLLLTITTLDTPEYQRTAQVISEQWKALGIKTLIQTLRKTDINREVLRQHNYDILLYGEIIGADPDPFPFWHSSQIEYPGLNLALFSNRTADKLLEDARVSTNPSERTDLYKKFQDTLLAENPAIFLYTPTYNFVINKKVKGVSFGNLVSPADRYATLKDWYIKTKWIWK
jgi:peptide/nickel transport system substrate-binding protein